jgi:hypothetical protein
MKKKTLGLIVFLCFFVSACSLLRVQKFEDGKTTKVCGIPFYCKVNNYYHVTRYLQTVYSVSFQYKKTGDKEWKRETRKLGESQLISVKEWFTKLSKNIDETKLENDLAQFRTNEFNEKNIKELFPCELVANTIETRLELDTSKIYYINQTMPLIGSSSLETELNPDGTLAKAKSTADSQTLAKVLDFAAAAIPFKEFLSMKWGITPDKGPSAGEFEINLSIEAKMFLYTLTEKVKTKDLGVGKVDTPPDVPVKLDLTCDNSGNCWPKEDKKISFEKKEIKPDAEKKDEKPEKKTIELSGQIALPSEKK